jgi:hypothetical protein
VSHNIHWISHSITHVRDDAFRGQPSSNTLPVTQAALGDRLDTHVNRCSLADLITYTLVGKKDQTWVL